MAEQFPSWKQALITFLGGIVLAGSTCFGFLVTLQSSNDNLSAFLAMTFVGSLIVILIGFVFVLMRLVREMSKKGKP